MGGKFEGLSHSDYALRKTFSKEGVAVYQDAVKTFRQGNQAVSQAAKENAYLYARMAERWAQIRRDYGDTAYTAKDFAAAHPIYIGGTRSDVQFGQRAWHGSSHDFDKFDLGYIGTGEGAQAHGWGLYFAGNKDISQGYANKLSNPVGEVNVAGIIYSIGRGGGSWRVRNIATGELISKMKIVKAISALYTEQGKDKALKYLKDKADQTRKFKKIWIDAYDWLKNQEIDDK